MKLTLSLKEQPLSRVHKFEWKDRNNNFYCVEDMATRHLFFTLRMIWNHTMPEEAKLKPYNKYKFGEFYTEAYLMDAIINIYYELIKRPDIMPAWRADLEHMHNYVNLQSINIQELKAES